MSYCVICWEDASNGQVLLKLHSKNDHRMHYDCFMQLSDQMYCPICKNKIKCPRMFRRQAKVIINQGRRQIKFIRTIQKSKYDKAAKMAKEGGIWGSTIKIFHLQPEMYPRPIPRHWEISWMIGIGFFAKTFNVTIEIMLLWAVVYLRDIKLLRAALKHGANPRCLGGFAMIKATHFDLFDFIDLMNQFCKPVMCLKTEPLKPTTRGLRDKCKCKKCREMENHAS